MNSNSRGESILDLFSKKYASRLVICMIINIGQEMSCLPIFTYYSNLIFLKMEKNVNATFYSICMGISELVGSLLGIFVIDKFGRKKMFVFGYFAILACLISWTILHFTDSSTWAHKYICIIYYFIAGLSTDPVPWIINADLLPETGTGLASCINWIGVIIALFTFPKMIDNENYGMKGAFLLYTVSTSFMLIYMIIFFKETQDKNKIEIEKMYSTWC